MSHSPKISPDRQNAWWSRWLRLLRVVAIGYLSIVLLLSLLQRSLMYVPTRASELPVTLTKGGLGTGQDITVTTGDGLTLHGWHLLPSGRRLVLQDDFDSSLKDRDEFVLIYFPGNGGNRRHRIEDFKLLSELPVHIIAFDYRGYGENPGSPSEAMLAIDAHSIWNYVTQTRGVSPDKILLYGESLGGGVATRLAAELCQAGTPPGGLILCSTFSSMVDAASYHYPWLPVSWVLQDRYLSIEKIPHVTAPILCLHGQRDTIVPIRLGKKLFDAAPPKSGSGIAKSLVELPRSDHNDILLTDEAKYRDGLQKFVKSLK